MEEKAFVALFFCFVLVFFEPFLRVLAVESRQVNVHRGMTDDIPGPAWGSDFISQASLPDLADG